MTVELARSARVKEQFSFCTVVILEFSRSSRLYRRNSVTSKSSITHNTHGGYAHAEENTHNEPTKDGRL